MAKKTSALDHLIFIASRLPWWLSLALAAILGLWLHSVASTPLPIAADPHALPAAVTHSVFRAFATFGQFLLPLAFVVGALVSVFGRRKRKGLLTHAAQRGNEAVAGMSWREFELLVGEALRRRGFSIEETGGNGPDGGIDLIARKDGERYLVQCKHWRAIQVGVPTVRELYGAMAAEGAVGGFVITSGTFTQPAREFASGRNLQLVDGAQLKSWIVAAQRKEPIFEKPVEPVAVPAAQSTEAPQPEAPACPFCRKTMVIRVARTGANAGGKFWGCTAYPQCRGIRQIFTGGRRGV